MRIVIAGAGDVGFHLARLLALESQDITIIDTDRDKLEYVASHLDVNTITGSATSFSLLKEAQVQECDLFIAVTSSEEVNFTSAVLSKRLGAKRTVVRVSNVEFLFTKKDNFMQDMGIDEVILPEVLAAKEIRRLVTHAQFTDHFSFEAGKLSLLGIKVDSQSRFVGKALRDVVSDGDMEHFRNVAILRNNQTIIPEHDSILEDNDHAYFISDQAGEDLILGLANKSKNQIRRIMILGGSRVAYHAAKLLSKKYKVRLIAQEKDHCHELAEQLEDVLVIQGNSNDVDLLKEEDLEEMDVVIALTDSSETNIISCLMAKNHGVQNTIALVENVDYTHISQSVGVDTMINKRLIAANFIFKYVRKGDVMAMAGIHGADCEVLEFEVKESDAIHHKSMKKLKIPANACIGGVVRDGKAIIPDEHFMFKDRDRVVVLAKPESIKPVEQLFS